MRESTFDELQALEKSLATARLTPDELSSVLAEECMEFGRSGSRYNRQQILDAVVQRGSAEVLLSDFKIHPLDLNTVLVTYQTRHCEEAGDLCTWRSSVWSRARGEWQLVFHQGTPTQCL